MMYEIAFTQSAYVLLIILTLIYFHGQRYYKVKNLAYKFLLFLGLLVCTFEIIYVFSITHLDINILSYITYKGYIISQMTWWNIYLIYWLCTSSYRHVDSSKDVIKQSKILKIWLSISCVAIVGYLFVKFTGMTPNTLDFLHGASGFYATISAFVVNIILAVTISKNKEALSKTERFSFWFGFGIIFFEVILQYFMRGISVFPSCFALIIYIIYFAAENPDIQTLQEITEAQGDIEQSNQTKTDFLSNMTYEIKTPMMLISSLCDELINMPVYDEKLFKDDIGQIVSSGNSMLDIVNNILDISKIETGKQTLVEKEYKTIDLLTDVVNITKSKIGSKPVKLIINADQNISSTLNGDYSKLYQVLINILANSAKYTDVGRITFTLSSTKENDKEILLFKINDTGTGIKEEDQSKLFEKGTRLNNATDSEIEGSGYGLAITKQYVETLGGKIWFESKFRVGSTFYIEVPQKIVDATPISQTMQQQPKAETNEKKDCSAYTVLIVDDNLLNIKVAKRVLEGYKFNVESVTAGKDCVYKIKEGVKYDAIFMDHMMPEMDGIETLHVLKKLDGYELPPIIALTANAVSGMKEMYLAEGFDDYLSKPINIQELDRVVNKFFK